MEIYFSAKTAACYPEELRADYEKSGTWPDDGVIIEREEFERFFLNPAPDGYKLGVSIGRPAWIVDAEYSASLEKGWIESELKRSADQIDKAQDSDPSAIGTETDWRAYRVALRAWPQDENFPNKELRPIAPDAQ